jgi:hypothetical protein
VLEMMVAAPKISSDPLLCSDETAVAAWACHFPLKRLTGPDRDMSVFILHDCSGSHRHRLGRFFGRFRRLKPEVCGRAWLMNYLSN